LRLVDGVL